MHVEKGWETLAKTMLPNQIAIAKNAVLTRCLQISCFFKGIQMKPVWLGESTKYNCIDLLLTIKEFKEETIFAFKHVPMP